MTLPIVVSLPARADLATIWQYGLTKWSETQAERYLRDLHSMFRLLADNPDMGRHRDEIDPPVNTYPYRSHLIIYRRLDDMIVILRVMHGRSNWIERLHE